MGTESVSPDHIYIRTELPLRLRVSQSTVDHLLQTGELASIVIAGRNSTKRRPMYRVTEAQVLAYLAKATRSPDAPLAAPRRRRAS